MEYSILRRRMTQQKPHSSSFCKIAEKSWRTISSRKSSVWWRKYLVENYYPIFLQLIELPVVFSYRRLLRRTEALQRRLCTDRHWLQVACLRDTLFPRYRLISEFSRTQFCRKRRIWNDPWKVRCFPHLIASRFQHRKLPDSQTVSFRGHARFSPGISSPLLLGCVSWKSCSASSFHGRHHLQWH